MGAWRRQGYNSVAQPASPPRTPWSLLRPAPQSATGLDFLASARFLCIQEEFGAESAPRI